MTDRSRGVDPEFFVTLRNELGCVLDHGHVYREDLAGLLAEWAEYICAGDSITIDAQPRED